LLRLIAINHLIVALSYYELFASYYFSTLLNL